MDYIIEILNNFGETFVAPLQNIFNFLPNETKGILIAIFSASLIPIIGWILARLDK